jgi:hypothetical protein
MGLRAGRRLNMKTNALNRVVVAMGLAAVIHAPFVAWAASQTEPAPKTIATAHKSSTPAHITLRGAQAKLTR